MFFISTYLEPLSYLIYFVALSLQYLGIREPKIMALIIMSGVGVILLSYANWILINTAVSNDKFYRIWFFVRFTFLCYYFYQCLGIKYKILIQIGGVVSTSFF